MPLYRYDNCYGILEEIRQGLNEYTVAFVQGTDTSGTFDNGNIVRKINAAQRFLWNLLFTRFPELFFTSTILTGTAGVYTLPSDLFMLHYIEDSNGQKIWKIPLKIKHSGNQTGSDSLYYRYGNTIIRDGGGSGSLTVYYYKRMKDLTQGMSSAGGALSLTLATSARKEIDYYNGIILENITDDSTDTITDYATTRIVTFATMTGAASDYYGTVSELPESFHPLIAPKALMMMKLLPVSLEKPSPQETVDFQMNLIETLRAFTGTFNSDVDMAEIFYDFAPIV